MFTGVGKDGGAALMGVVKIKSTLIRRSPEFETSVVIYSLLCCLSSDSSKNQAASETIESLLHACCWMNVHLTQPYGPVFEIRVHEGYGARWSQDGSKV